MYTIYSASEQPSKVSYFLVLSSLSIYLWDGVVCGLVSEKEWMVLAFINTVWIVIYVKNNDQTAQRVINYYTFKLITTPGIVQLDSMSPWSLEIFVLGNIFNDVSPARRFLTPLINLLISCLFFSTTGWKGGGGGGRASVSLPKGSYPPPQDTRQSLN